MPDTVTFKEPLGAFVDETTVDNSEEDDSQANAHGAFHQQGGGGTEGSVPSVGSAGSSSKSPTLRGNLTREHKDRDPLQTFQLIKVLGKGSMGNVSLVRKRSVGGSARFNAAARQAVQQKYEQCFQLPIIGGCLELCLRDKARREMHQAASSRDALIVLQSPGDAAAKNDNHNNNNDEEDSTQPTSLLSDTMTPSSSSKTNSSSQPIYAMKSIHYSLIQDPTFVHELRNEVMVLKTLDHPHIVRIQETFDYQQQLFVVMEVCTGGDLYTRDPYTEAQAARIIAQVLSAMAYMHQRHVIHRDLKYENILFASDAPTAAVKLIDFGLSQEIQDHEHIKDSAGTMCVVVACCCLLL